MCNNLAVLNNPMRDDLGRAIYTPSFLLLSSTVRLILSLHCPSGASLENCHYLLASLPRCITWIIWQCYFANTIASVLVFRRQWEAFVWWQRWLFYVVGSLILSVAFTVALGLLQYTNGPSPSLPLQLGILTPAILWAAPVFLSATLTIFRVNSGAAVRQMQERAGIHIVHLLLYFVFLRTSQLDNLAGAGSVSVCAMFILTFLGFTAQLLWRKYPRMFPFMPGMAPAREQVHYPEQEEQAPGRRELVICALGRPTPCMEEHDSMVVMRDKAPLCDTEEQLNNAELVATGHPPVPRETYYP